MRKTRKFNHLESRPLVSVLIATKGRPQVLLKCLSSVFGQDYPNFEVLVLDDNSESKNICEMLSAKLDGERVKCFRSNKRLGVAGARNLLMRNGRGRIFIFIDDDAIFVSNDCISRAVEYFKGDASVGILTFKIINHVAGRNELFVPFSRYQRFRCPNLVESKQEVSYYVGTGHAIRSEVVDQCGFYQDNFGYGGEEMDLSYRAVMSGIRVFYAPDIVVHHYPQPTTFGNRGWHSELYFVTRNRIWLAYKYLPLRYFPTYLLFWLGIYGFRALRALRMVDFFAGIKDGIKDLGLLERNPLSKDTVGYLHSHFGRLWY